MPTLFRSSQIGKEDIAAEPVLETVLSLACESGQAMETPLLPACAPGHVTDKSAQVGLLTRDEASQADEMKLLSTSASQTQPQAFSSGNLDNMHLKIKTMREPFPRLIDVDEPEEVPLRRREENKKRSGNDVPVVELKKIIEKKEKENIAFKKQLREANALNERLTHALLDKIEVTQTTTERQEGQVIAEFTLPSSLDADTGLPKEMLEDVRDEDTDATCLLPGSVAIDCSIAIGPLSSAALQESSSLADVRSRLHSCSLCTYVTLDQSAMNKHLQKHMGEPAFQCHLCPAAFTYNSKLVLHMRTHTGERPFSCVHCKASFKQEGHLAKHIRTHTGERPFSCVDCKASFAQKGHLVSHIRTHTRERPFSCVRCNASFSHKCDLTTHMLSHTGNLPFSCAHCNASFVRKHYLVRHIRTHTGERPFSCAHCNASYRMRRNLREHIRTHTGERPFQCVHCNKSFVTKRSLTVHIRTHTGDRPFSCVHCKASFKQLGHLVRHNRIHTEERPFSCVDCKTSFKQKWLLLKHIRTHTR